MTTTFIYALCEPGTRTVRYIGMTNSLKRRMREHIGSSVGYNSHLGHWIKSIISRGEKPAMIILREVPDDQREIAEERYIRLARGCGMNLVNGTDGGEGWSVGKKHSTESLFKMRKPKSETTRAKMRKPKSESHKASMRKPHSESHIEATSFGVRGTKRARSSSRFVGVVWCKANQNWVSRIKFNTQPDVSCGSFKSEIEAARAYDLAAIKIFGATASLNFMV